MVTSLLDDRPTILRTDAGVSIAATVMGSGPPVLLLHGYPQSRMMWHRVAPILAERFTVVATDLRGYGDSDKPTGDAYAKRSMAADQVDVMSQLGFERFAVVGHDRGARVAHRLALDDPARVSAVAVLDIVPTLHMFDNVDRRMATVYMHWFFLSQPGGLPEALIKAAPEAWFSNRFADRFIDPYTMHPTALDHYRRSFLAPGAIEAMCADYRAAATIDLEHDRRDAEAGHRIDAPLLALWGSGSYVGTSFDVGDVWSRFATRVTTASVAANHYVAEEAPTETAHALLGFLADGRGLDS